MSIQDIAIQSSAIVPLEYLKWLDKALQHLVFYCNVVLKKSGVSKAGLDFCKNQEEGVRLYDSGGPRTY